MEWHCIVNYFDAILYAVSNPDKKVFTTVINDEFYLVFWSDRQGTLHLKEINVHTSSETYLPVYKMAGSEICRESTWEKLVEEDCTCYITIRNNKVEKISGMTVEKILSTKLNGTFKIDSFVSSVPDGVE